MPKRNAATELTDRNWDQEEEAEEAGTFNFADEEELRKRPILKAKRTVNADGSRPGGGLFSGFALKLVGSAPSGGFGLSLSNAGSTQPKSNGSSETAKMNGSGKDSGCKDNPEYLRQLKMLNDNILAWIQKHVGENPYCILTPSFRDYEKHLHSLEEKYGVLTSGSADTDFKAGESAKPVGPAAKLLLAEKASAVAADDTSMMEASAEKTERKAAVFGGFSFGQSTNGSVGGQGAASFGGTSLGGTSVGAGASSFGGTAPKPFSFSFGSQASTGSAGSSQLQSQGTGEGAEDEEYVPPKPEVREIKEDGASYSKRCKLFYQKDGQWVDRGVGNLHLKSTDAGKTQLVVRADTNLGNILLNILLSSTIPTKRQGKNNVFIVCVPNPPISTKDPSSNPVPMLIRVKTPEDADELLAKLEECKGSS